MRKFFRRIVSRYVIVEEFFQFLRERKLLWITPAILMLLFIGVLLLVAQSTPVAPFIYALF